MKVNKLIKTILVCLFLITPLSIKANSINQFSLIPKSYNSNNEVIDYVQSLISLYKGKMYFTLQNEFVVDFNSLNYLNDYYETHSDIFAALINKTNNFEYTIDDIETDENVTTIHLTITNFDMIKVNQEVGLLPTLKKLIIDHEILGKQEVIDSINHVSELKEFNNVEIRVIQTDEGYRLLAVPLKARAALLGIELPF